MIIIWAVLVVLFVFFALIILVGAPYVPTKQADIKNLFGVIRLRKGALVVDLGSGDGRVMIQAAKYGYKAIGYELNPILALIAKYRLRQYSDATCKIGDYWQADIRKASMVFIFSAQTYMKRLSQKLNNELKPGAQVVSYGFSLPGRKIAKKVGAANIYQF